MCSSNGIDVIIENYVPCIQSARKDKNGFMLRTPNIFLEYPFDSVYFGKQTFLKVL